MTIPTTVSHPALAREVIKRELAVEVYIHTSTGPLDNRTDHYKSLT